MLPLKSTIKSESSSTDSSHSNKNYMKRKQNNRSYETIVMKYADKMKETYERNQEKVLDQTKENVSKIMDQTKENVSKMIASEQEMMEKMIANQRIILNETTNQLLHGLQNIFSAPTATRTVHASQMIPSVVSYNEAVPYVFPNELQHLQPSVILPKVLINMKRPLSANEEIQRVKIQKFDTNTVNSKKEKATMKDTITNTDMVDKTQ